MKLGSASRLGNPVSHSNLVLCCKGKTHKELCCTDGGCRGTWQENNGSALAMREATEVSQSLEDSDTHSLEDSDTHSLQLISKKQSEKCYVVPEERTTLGRCLQHLTIMRSLVQHKLKRHNEWLLGYRTELKETEYFRNFWLLSCFLKIRLLPSYISQF